MDCKWNAAGWTCALLLLAIGCGGDDGDSMNGATAGTGFGAAGTGLGAAGTGTSSAPNMPDAACMSAAGTSSPACSACACTPNTAGGCLTEVTACQSSADAMQNQLCGAILACARTNNCTGMACVGPCMTEIFAAITYMGGIATTNASTVGMCTSTKCAAVCPTGAMPGAAGTGASGTGASGTGASGTGASGTGAAGTGIGGMTAAGAGGT